jgi:hypothetical protein
VAAKRRRQARWPELWPTSGELEVVGLGGSNMLTSPQPNNRLRIRRRRCLPRPGTPRPTCVFLRPCSQHFARGTTARFETMRPSRAHPASELSLDAPLRGSSERNRLHAPSFDCYLFDLAKSYSSFFEFCPVLKADTPKAATHAILCDLTARTIGRASVARNRRCGEDATPKESSMPLRPRPSHDRPHPIDFRGSYGGIARRCGSYLKVFEKLAPADVHDDCGGKLVWPRPASVLFTAAGDGADR